MTKRKEQVYQITDYDDICPEERKKVLAPYIVADTILAVNRLLFAEGIGLQMTMQESIDGEDMYCFIKNL